jgi:hypothetical protein
VRKSLTSRCPLWGKTGLHLGQFAFPLEPMRHYSLAFDSQFGIGGPKPHPKAHNLYYLKDNDMADAVSPATG